MSESDHKQLWVLSGGNGAGKSTYYEQALAPNGALLVNADVIAKSMSPENPEKVSYAAAQTAMQLLKQYLDDGISFVYETVFSHTSKIDLVKLAKQRGYEVILIYIHVDEGLNAARVKQRVEKNGHDVPIEKILSRLPRTKENVKAAAEFSDTFLIYDNSNKDAPLNLAAEKQGSKVRIKSNPLPKWAENLLF